MTGSSVIIQPHDVQVAMTSSAISIVGLHGGGRIVDTKLRHDSREDR